MIPVAQEVGFDDCGVTEMMLDLGGFLAFLTQFIHNSFILRDRDMGGVFSLRGMRRSMKTHATIYSDRCTLS